MQKRPVRHPETAYRSIGDEGGLVVLPVRSEVKVLNPVASKIYSMLDGTHTLDEIAGAVVEEFEVGADQALADVQGFIHELTHESMVAEKPDGGDDKSKGSPG